MMLPNPPLQLRSSSLPAVGCADGLVVQADVSRPEQITHMFRKVQGEFGKLDIFVSNARPEAAAVFYPPMDITLEQWDAAFDSQAKAFLVGVCEAVGTHDYFSHSTAVSSFQRTRGTAIRPQTAHR